jgi:hypothetical protein
MTERPIQKEPFRGTEKTKKIFDDIIKSKKENKCFFTKKEINDLVMENPNDADLGRKIRSLVNSKK